MKVPVWTKEVFRAMIAVLFAAYPISAFSGPKEDCEFVVQSLGFPTDDYAFKKGGIFSSDQHIFGSLSCYVDYEGKFNSLYRGDTAIAEDGYFGTSVLAARDAAVQKAEAADDLEATKRDAAIRSARERYDLASQKISDDLRKELSALRESSDPFGKHAQKDNASETATTPTVSGSEDDQSEKDSTKKASAEHSEVPLTAPDSAPDQVSKAVGTREMWVSAERLNIRSCPSEKCGRTGWLLSGNKLTIYEERNGWGRISEPMDAICESGVSGQIDDGDRRCVPENGVTDNKITRWVSLRHLSETPPKPASDPQKCGNGFLAGSDNYETYAEAFCTAAIKLISEGQCTEKEFRDNGGWWASTSYPKGTFFTYCGGLALSNKIYLEAKTGRIFR